MPSPQSRQKVAAIKMSENTAGSFTDRLVNYLQRSLISLTRPLPFVWRGAVAGRILQAVLVLLPKFDRRIRNNLILVFPEMKKAERRKLHRRIVLNIGRTFAEILHSRDLVKRSAQFHVSGPGFETLQRARAEGRGAIIVSGHFGQWEAVRISLLKAGMECSALYRPHNNLLFDVQFLAAIRRSGKPIFPRGSSGMRNMIRYLRSGGFVALMHDQAIKSAPLFRFMGLPAHTAMTAAELALKYNLPLVPAFGLRRSDPAEIDVFFEDPIPRGPPEEMTQAVNDSLSARVRANPEQWFWLHQRWKIAGKSTKD